MLHDPANPLPGITARRHDGVVVDLHFGRDLHGVSRITEIHPHRDGTDGHPVGWLDLGDFVMSPAAAEPHAHLDKALSWSQIRPPLGDLSLAIASWRAASAGLDTDSFFRRGYEAATTMLANGITAVRTHVDLLGDPDPVRAVSAIAAVRRALDGLMTIQIAVLVPPTSPSHLVEEALDAGADLIGGAPHIAADPTQDLHRLLDLAERRGVGVDLHIDEFIDGDQRTVDDFADRVANWPVGRIRTAGHCSVLSTMPPERLSRTVAALARASVSVVALPMTNLYLQGRSGPSRGRRAITAIDELRAGGVLVAAGADNVRDPFNPVGRCDPLETAVLLVTAGHQTPHAAMDLVTTSARAVLGLEPAGPIVGARADLLAVMGTDLVETLATASSDRVVIVNGAVVARTQTTRQMAVPQKPPMGMSPTR